MSSPTGLIRGQSKEAIRRANLSAALASLRLAGRQSRSELIGSLHLSRTTVLEIVGQLVELGLATELETPASVGVGRPSYVVSPAETLGAFAVNPESDALSVGVIDFRGRIIARRRMPTPRPLTPVEAAEAAAGLMRELGEELPSDFRMAGVGVAIPGQVQRGSGLIRLAPRLGWRDVDFVSLLGGATRMRVRIDNNARLVTLAEHRYGKGRGVADFTYVFAGAGGIGGATVANHRIVEGRHGFAGEIGHTRLTQDADTDFGGITGTLEALVRRDDLLALFGGDDLSDDELHRMIQSAPDGELHALAAEQLRMVGVFLGNLANIFDPELVVLGGFIGSLYSRYPELLAAAMNQIALPAIGEDLVIEVSVDNAAMALIGAAELVFDEIVEEPIEEATAIARN